MVALKPMEGSSIGWGKLPIYEVSTIIEYTDILQGWKEHIMFIMHLNSVDRFVWHEISWIIQLRGEIGGRNGLLTKGCPFFWDN